MCSALYVSYQSALSLHHSSDEKDRKKTAAPPVVMRQPGLMIDASFPYFHLEVKLNVLVNVFPSLSVIVTVTGISVPDGQDDEITAFTPVRL